MKTLVDYFPDLYPFSEADSFFCFAKVWWDGAGLDSSFWWKNEGGSFFRLNHSTGETAEPIIPRETRSDFIEPSELNSLLEAYQNFGGRSLESQLQRTSYHHYDIWIGVKIDSIREPHWISVAGGAAVDSKLGNLIDKIYDAYLDLDV